MPLEKLQSAHDKTKENNDSANAYIKKDDDTDGEIGRDGEGQNIFSYNDNWTEQNVYWKFWNSFVENFPDYCLTEIQSRAKETSAALWQINH